MYLFSDLVILFLRMNFFGGYKVVCIKIVIVVLCVEVKDRKWFKCLSRDRLN